jgi:hypothetical protein
LISRHFYRLRYVLIRDIGQYAQKLNSPEIEIRKTKSGRWGGFDFGVKILPCADFSANTDGKLVHKRQISDKFPFPNPD